jgi:hypothetical protein
MCDRALTRRVVCCLYSIWRHCRRGSGHLQAKKCPDAPKKRFLSRSCGEQRRPLANTKARLWPPPSLREYGAFPCTRWRNGRALAETRDHLRRVRQPVMGYPSGMPGPGEALTGMTTNTQVTARSPKPSARAPTVPMRSSSGTRLRCHGDAVGLLEGAVTHHALHCHHACPQDGRWRGCSPANSAHRRTHGRDSLPRPVNHARVSARKPELE